MLRLIWKEWLTAHAVHAFKVCLAFYGCSFFRGIFVNGTKQIKKFSHKLFVIVSFALLESSYLNFLRSIRMILFLTNFTQMLSFNRYEKITCENCGTQTSKPNVAHPRKGCSIGTLHCTQCTKFSRNHKIIWITILLRSTAPQDLKSPSSVNFVSKRVQDFTLYVYTKTRKTECRSDQEQELRMWKR